MQVPMAILSVFYVVGMLLWSILCGRYTVTLDPRLLISRFNAELADPIQPRYNAAPGQDLPVIRNTSPDKIHLHQWGLIPHWAKSAQHGYKLINTRAETILEKPMFRTPFQKHRCLLLADGFYEWQKTSGGKQPHRIVLENEAPFAFAGIWSLWQDERQSKIFSFSIITTEANSVVAEIHSRMPVILHPKDEQKWLTTSSEDAMALLKPYPASLMRTYEVARLVNSPKNDSPEVIQPLQLRKRPYKMQKRPERRLDEFFKTS